MATKNVVTIVSRALAFYLFCWAISEVTYLPSRFFSFVHYEKALTVLAPHTYGRDLDGISLGFSVLRIIGLFVAARWLYRPGPGVEKYFLGSSGLETSSNE